jgi:hypothetical protein
MYLFRPVSCPIILLTFLSKVITLQTQGNGTFLRINFTDTGDCIFRHRITKSGNSLEHCRVFDA